MLTTKVLLAARGALDEALGWPQRAAESRYRHATSGIEGATAFAGLHAQSLALSAIRVRSLPPALNVVLPQYSLDAMFAGVRTALEFGLRLGLALRYRVRIIALTGRLTARRRHDVSNFIEAEFGMLAASISAVVSSAELTSLQVGDNDLWIATHWVTAHALDIAARLSLVDAKRVIYLVQDYEPGFNAWSSEYAIAQRTYHAGFTLVVNSAPLAKHLRAYERIDVDPDLVFRPQLDMERLETCARERRAAGAAEGRVLFYARPNKPRNLYAIGMAALALTALTAESRGMRVSVRSAGARHPVPKVGPLRRMEVLGRLTWPRYFETLARSDVLLSLQCSPHPSHPPLDAVVSGGWAVTNDFDDIRGGLHERLLACPPDPRDLSNGLLAALNHTRDPSAKPKFTPDFVEKLGNDIEYVIAQTAVRVSA